jgi:hypothetical protein
MKAHSLLSKVLVAIAAITVLSGLGQLLVPGFVLRIVGGTPSPAANHFFGIVGMFMVLFGGMLLQALLSAGHHPIVVFWSGLQKFGASAAVALGVLRAVFGPLALLVAGFDLLSGLLILAYWRMIRSEPFVSSSLSAERKGP